MKKKTKKILTELVFFAGVLLLAGVISGFVDLSLPKQEADAEATTVEITEEQFKQLIFDFTAGGEWKYKGTKPAIVDFYATWCPPCKRLRPRLETIAKEYGDEIIVYTIDSDQAARASAAMGVRVLPTLLFIPVEGTPTKSEGLLRLSQLRSQVDEILLGKK